LISKSFREKHFQEEIITALTNNNPEFEAKMERAVSILQGVMVRKKLKTGDTKYDPSFEGCLSAIFKEAQKRADSSLGVLETFAEEVAYIVNTAQNGWHGPEVQDGWIEPLKNPEWPRPFKG
jgi:hypothetical protein